MQDSINGEVSTLIDRLSGRLAYPSEWYGKDGKHGRASEKCWVSPCNY